LDDLEQQELYKL